MLENAGLTLLTAEECVKTVGGTTTKNTFRGADGNFYTSIKTVTNGQTSITVRPATLHEAGMAEIMETLAK